jgi:hypothetical protein
MSRVTAYAFSFAGARLSPFFTSFYWSLPPHSIPPIVQCPWLALMYCVGVEKAEAR